MEYELHTHYPLSEEDNISEWWQTHRQYKIEKNIEEGYLEIVENSEGNIILVNDYKMYLYETDWVVVKIQEASLFGESDVEELKSKYADIIEKRREARTRINELENLSK